MIEQVIKKVRAGREEEDDTANDERFEESE